MNTTKFHPNTIKMVFNKLATNKGCIRVEKFTFKQVDNNFYVFIGENNKSSFCGSLSEVQTRRYTQTKRYTHSAYDDKDHATLIEAFNLLKQTEIIFGIAHRK